MEVLEKPFIDIDDQLQKLISRGLGISDLEEARNHLMRVTYYDLINGYKNMFLHPKSHENDEDAFISGTKFEDIISLYKLDRELRNATLEITLDIECIFYASIAYSLSKTYGEKESSYLNETNFKRGVKQGYNGKYERDNLLSVLLDKVKRPKIQPLIHYKKKYNNIPPWILVKGMTFGELVMLYKLSTQEVKNQVMENILGEKADETAKELFSVSIKIFNKFRNWAAHGGRIYNHNCRIELPYNNLHYSLFGITKEKYINGTGKSDFASLVIAAMFFLRKDYNDMLEFIVKLRVNLQNYQKENPLHFENVIQEMGLPSNYYQSIQDVITKS